MLNISPRITKSDRFADLNLPKPPSRLSTSEGLSSEAGLRDHPSTEPSTPRAEPPAWVEKSFTNGQPDPAATKAVTDAFADASSPEAFPQLWLGVRHKVAKEVAKALGIAPGEPVSYEKQFRGGLLVTAAGYQTLLTQGDNGTVNIEAPRPVGLPAERDRLAVASIEQQFTENLRQLVEHRPLLVEKIQGDGSNAEIIEDRILAILTKGIAHKEGYLGCSLKTSVVGGDLWVTVNGANGLKLEQELFHAKIPLVTLLGKETGALPRSRVGRIEKDFEVIGSEDKTPPQWGKALFQEHQIEILAPARFEQDRGLLLHYGMEISYRTPDLKVREVPVLQIVDPGGSGEVRDYPLKPGDRVFISDRKRTGAIDVRISSRSGIEWSVIPGLGGR